MDKLVFIIILIAILVTMLFSKCKENFSSPSNSVDNTGIFNYFYWFYMNPYPLPMNKFFSNDKVGTVNDK
jgi:hypothetical protein